MKNNEFILTRRQSQGITRKHRKLCGLPNVDLEAVIGFKMGCNTVHVGVLVEDDLKTKFASNSCSPFVRYMLRCLAFVRLHFLHHTLIQAFTSLVGAIFFPEQHYNTAFVSTANLPENGLWVEGTAHPKVGWHRNKDLCAVNILSSPHACQDKAVVLFGQTRRVCVAEETKEVRI